MRPPGSGGSITTGYVLQPRHPIASWCVARHCRWVRGARPDGVVSGLPAAPAVVARRPGAQVLDVVLERITYANEESGYTIARVATDRSATDLVTVVGALLGVQPGESLRLVGRWVSHRGMGGSSRSTPTPRCCRP